MIASPCIARAVHARAITHERRTEMITVYYKSIDGVRKHEVCQDLQHAREWASYWVGKHPTVGSSYAVSDDGIGKVSVAGCTIRDLFKD
jgi:hypothetical protein